MATTTNFGWETPDDTDLVKDGALAIRTLGSAIDTSLVDLKGGTTGQVLSKTSNTDMDFTWITNAAGIPATILDAKGDLIVASAADTAARLAVGTNGQYLKADSTTATGLAWATFPSTGKVLQVVQGQTTTSTTIATTTLTDTGITATITPSATSSKILVFVNGQCFFNRASGGGIGIGAKLLRGATTIADYADSMLNYIQVTGATYVSHAATMNITYLDSPATTSATTYKLQAKVSTTSNSGTSTWQEAAVPSQIVLMEIGA